MQKLLVSAGLVLLSVATMAQSNKVLSAYNYLNRGDLIEAKEAIDAAAVHEKTMNDPKTFLYRGNIYYELYTSKDEKYAAYKKGALDEAAASYDKALETIDNSRKVNKSEVMNQYYRLINSYYSSGNDANQAGDFGGASQEFEKVALLRENVFEEFDTVAYYYAGFLASKNEETDRAIALLQKVAPTGYEGSGVYYEIARLQMSKEDTDAASATIDEGLSKYPGDNNLMLLQTNLFLKDESKMGEAIENLNATIASDPNNAALYYARGALLQKDSTRLAEAEADFKKTIELDPNHFEANYNLGALYVNQSGAIQDEMNALDFSAQKEYDALKVQRDELFTKAIAPLEKALELEPEEKGVRAILLELYGKTGQTEKYNEMKSSLSK
jgi:tetratricopeptide (TPR) repeat protein